LDLRKIAIERLNENGWQRVILGVPRNKPTYDQE